MIYAFGYHTLRESWNRNKSSLLLTGLSIDKPVHLFVYTRPLILQGHLRIRMHCTVSFLQQCITCWSGVGYVTSLYHMFRSFVQCWANSPRAMVSVTGRFKRPMAGKLHSTLWPCYKIQFYFIEPRHFEKFELSDARFQIFLKGVVANYSS